MRKFIRTTFAIFILASISLVIVSFFNKEWGTITASISLIIAIISGWIAYEVFYKQTQAEKPQIVLRLDFRSRHSLVLLVAENSGTRPAFNISIKWDRELENHKGEPVKFNKYDNGPDIPVLNAKETTSTIVDTPHNLFNRYKEIGFDFSGIISYQETLNSKRKTSYPFLFSIKHYGNSPETENEEPKTMVELQKIPKKLEEITKELKKISENSDKKPSA